MIKIFDDDKHYTVERYGGVAWAYLGPEVNMVPVEPEGWDDLEWCGHFPEYPDDFEEVPTGMVLMVMVGDDAVFTFDPDDVTEIPEDAFCHECGQIGCGWA